MKLHVKSLLFWLVASLLLGSCSGDDNEPTDANGSQQLAADARSNIIGSWGFAYSETQCEEQYEFSLDGSFSQTSLDEELVGSYFIDDFETNMTQLTLRPTQDNLGTDCLGSNEDSTTRDFIFIVSFPTAEQMDWARTSDPSLVIVTLNRR